MLTDEQEIEWYHLVIDYLYDSLGPAADDIYEMACDYADEELGR